MDRAYHSQPSSLWCVVLSGSSLKVLLTALIFPTDWMDAFPICLALFALNILNPGRLLFGRNAGQPVSQQQQNEYPIQTGRLGGDSPVDDSTMATPRRSISK